MGIGIVRIEYQRLLEQRLDEFPPPSGLPEPRQGAVFRGILRVESKGLFEMTLRLPELLAGREHDPERQMRQGSGRFEGQRALGLELGRVRPPRVQQTQREKRVSVRVFRIETKGLLERLDSAPGISLQRLLARAQEPLLDRNWHRYPSTRGSSPFAPPSTIPRPRMPPRIATRAPLRTGPP